MAARRSAGPGDQGESLIARSFKQCYITDRKTLPAGVTLLQNIQKNLAEGPDWIQIREKDLSAHDLFELIQAGMELPNPRGVRFMVNSRVDVAIAAGAAGAHLPADSPAPSEWRSLVPEGFLLGVSCHSVDEVRRAEERGADYVLFGPVFDPLSKAAAIPPLGVAELAKAAAAVSIPVLALGGITAANAVECIAAGAAGIAGIFLYQGSC